MMKVVYLADGGYLKQLPMIIVLPSLILHSLFYLRVILDEFGELFVIQGSNGALALASDTCCPFGII